MEAWRLGKLSVGNAIDRERDKIRLRVPPGHFLDAAMVDLRLRELEAPESHDAEEVLSARGVRRGDGAYLHGVVHKSSVFGVQDDLLPAPHPADRIVDADLPDCPLGHCGPPDAPRP